MEVYTTHPPKRQVRPKPGQVRVFKIWNIFPSPENDKLYKPVDKSDPDFVALVDSVVAIGIKEPLVVTRDGYILSGHRRHAAAKEAGLDNLPCRVENISHCNDPGQFIILLREYNRQRVKSLDEQLREEVVSASPEAAYESLIEHRRRSAEMQVDTFEISGEKVRCEISAAKKEFLAAIKSALSARRDYWPLSDRQIHYALLNDPPLKHASKPDSRYANDAASYKNLTDLLTRARLVGLVPMNAIADETRPTANWNVFGSPQPFLRREIDGMFKGYWRDLMQSQPNHIEIIGEKNTIHSVVKRVAERYCIPYTIGRGYCSLPPRHAIAQRFKKSGKSKLVVLVLSDFDPDGEEIAHSLARSLRDDFGIQSIEPIKVALTAAQVEEFKLVPFMKAKGSEDSTKRNNFVAKYGDDVFELEALSPETLESLLTTAIDSVIDVEKFNAELDAEKADAAFLDTVRQRVHLALNGIVDGGVAHA
jgi:hypothetical protein